jgi:hypothetical protein
MLSLLLVNIVKVWSATLVETVPLRVNQVIVPAASLTQTGATIALTAAPPTATLSSSTATKSIALAMGQSALNGTLPVRVLNKDLLNSGDVILQVSGELKLHVLNSTEKGLMIYLKSALFLS